MKLKVVLPVLGSVLKSPVVIGTAIVIILYLNFVFFVARYKKGPPRPKKRRVAAPSPAPVKKPEDEENPSNDSEME